MIKIFKKLLDLIYSKSCYFCSKSDENIIFCSKCRKDIKYLPLNPDKSIIGVSVYAVSYYQNTVKKLIKAVKFHNKPELAEYQAEIMFDYWENTGICNRNYTVIPVPMFHKKEKKRKYNHMNLVGKKFCEYTGYKFDGTSLIRNRDTLPQYTLSVKEREKNLKGAFTLINKDVKEPLLIIDDITTSGSTLREIICELKSNGYSDITCFVTSVAKYD